jgi:hypothetical protein
LKLLRRAEQARRRPTRRFPLRAISMVIAMIALFILLLIGLTIVEALILGLRSW